MALIVRRLAVLSCLLGYCVSAWLLTTQTVPYESKTLKLVIILFRNGANRPLHTYKSDPYRDYQWPDGKGSLTNDGKLQLFELGRNIRRYYGNFIPEEYHEENVFVASSDISRCMMSASTFLAGLFPPTDRQRWHPNIPWQPIPVHSLPRQFDNIFGVVKPCKLLKDMYYEHLAGLDAAFNENKEYSEVFEYVSQHTSQIVRSVSQVDVIYNILLAQRNANLVLPDWTKNVFPTKMRVSQMFVNALSSYNETMQRLRMGPLLWHIRSSLQETVSNVKNQKLSVFSGYGVNVVGLWRALGFEELLEPSHGASMLLELHQQSAPWWTSSLQNFSFVKVFYRNNTDMVVPMELKLRFCDDPCPYSEFLKHINKLIPDDWEEECHNPC